MFGRPALSGGPRFYGLKTISSGITINAKLIAYSGVAKALFVKLYNLSLSVSITVLK
jgi:hypothetical protein